MNKHLLVNAFCALVLFFGITANANAQFGLEDLQGLSSGMNGINPTQSFGEISPGIDAQFNNLGLIPTTASPAPFEEFEVELTAPGSRYNGAMITWLLNGKEVTEARNSRKHTFTAGPLGEKMVLKAVLNKSDGSTETTSIDITPVRIDIIIEGLTEVPHFYKGRPLPSRESEVRAVAIITTGDTVSRSNLSYDWRMNNDPLSGGSIRGKSGINFKMPLGRETYIGVTIQDGGKILGSKTIVVPVAEPDIIFYEESPLRGSLGKAINGTHIISGNQITVRAVPYYITPFLNNDDIDISWTLNSQTIDNKSSLEENVLTLRGSGTNSQASLGFKAINRKVIGQSVRDGVSLQFGQ